MEIKINGVSCHSEAGEFILAVARRNRIPIPTLCHHDGLPGQGCCRVCLVEAVENGWAKMVMACVYPVTDGLEVFTNTDRVEAVRRQNLALLRLRAPEAERVRQLCKLYKVPDDERFEAMAGERCILCGLCARACLALGTGAIATVHRGVAKKIAAPYEEPPEDCIGCGSCAESCPTSAIPMEETAETRTIWGRVFTMLRCARCGVPFTTEEAARHAAESTGQEAAAFCPRCRRERIGATMCDVYGY